MEIVYVCEGCGRYSFDKDRYFPATNLLKVVIAKGLLSVDLEKCFSCKNRK